MNRPFIIGGIGMAIIVAAIALSFVIDRKADAPADAPSVPASAKAVSPPGASAQGAMTGVWFC